MLYSTGIALMSLHKSAKREAAVLKLAPLPAGRSLLVWLVQHNATANWFDYKTARRLFGSACKACSESVLTAEVGKYWFTHRCSSESSRHLCRVCDTVVSGLPFWQFNGITHWGCLQEQQAYEQFTPTHQEAYLTLTWGFPDLR